MSNSIKHLIFCLMGPTASGKTQLAIELLQFFPFEIISVDSAMVYKGMDIGTSKPRPDLLAEAPHRLINIRDPAEIYSAAQFCKDVVKEIEDIQQKGRIPLLVGGTMLYFKAFQKGLSLLPSADPSIRDQLAREGVAEGWPALHARLMAVDPIAAKRIHPHDSQRIQRALEVYLLTGKSLTEWQSATDFMEHLTQESVLDIHNLGLIPEDRHLLHDRIAARFQAMLAEGFVEEVENLFHRPDLNLNLPSIRSVGYRQIWEYLEGNYHHNDMVEKGIIATRQLAKRQLTWLRSWENLISFESDSSNLKQQVMAAINAILDKA